MSLMLWLNVGCGRMIMPREKPAAHGLVDDTVYNPALAWDNADRVAQPGVNVVFDAFEYPWPMADNAYDGALLSHLVEHIPHEARLKPDASSALASLQDGWFTFFSELHRVMKPGAVAHILAPYAFSLGAVSDPTHTRYVTEHSFSYFVPNNDAPFLYNVGSEWGVLEYKVSYIEPPPLLAADGSAAVIAQGETLAQHMINIYTDLYIKLRAIK